MQAPQGSYQAYPAQPQNGIGTAGFVCGLVGLVFVFLPIPYIGLLALVLLIVGVVMSGIGISKANKGQATNKGLAIGGLVVSIVGLAIFLIAVVALASFLSSL